jgi:hypothetical protein
MRQKPALAKTCRKKTAIRPHLRRIASHGAESLILLAPGRVEWILNGIAT